MGDSVVWVPVSSPVNSELVSSPVNPASQSNRHRHLMRYSWLFTADGTGGAGVKAGTAFTVATACIAGTASSKNVYHKIL